MQKHLPPGRENTISPRRGLVVSIHDVSPLTRERTERILSELAECGVSRTSLLVVPDHHRRGNITKDAAFAAWLREISATGHEIVLHGYFHLRDEKPAEGLWTRVVTKSYTAGEGEFFDLDHAEALRRIRLGLDDLAACGVRTAGFIAPAWLLGADAEAAVREAGLEYTTRIATVTDFVAGRVHRSRSLVWSVRAAWRRLCSLAWNAAVAKAATGNPLARIGIHPPDWNHAFIRAQVLALTRATLAGREAITYETWLSSTRTAA